MCKCSKENCDLEVFENADKCILHCEKDNWYEVDDNGNKNWDKSKRNINLFWKKIQKDLDEKYEMSFYEPEVRKEIYIYNNVIFPKFQEDVPYNKYEDNADKLGTNFYSYFWFTDIEGRYREELNMIISELNVSFKNCKFLDNVELSRYNFTKVLEIKNCTFEKNLILKNVIFKKGSKIRIKNCSVIEYVNFENTTFEDLADFNNTSFNKINFYKTTFKDIAVFTETIFNKKVDFKHTTFEKLSIFRNSEFKDSINLKDAIFKEKANFLEIKTKVANRETARIIKDSFEQQNNIIEANKFYALEMKEREKELSPKKDFFEWLVFKVHNISSNHSQDWFSCLLWIIIFSFVVGLFNQKYYFEVDKYIFISLILLVPIFIGLIFDETKRKIGLSLFIILFYWNTSINLNFVSNLINPFSIMTGKDELTFGILIYKITIAYLIYQLIISIRQNTRRK